MEFERASFVSASLENLADDTPRLVLADWLDEHGEPDRAEFIRCQIEAARLPHTKREKSKVYRRAEELLKKHEARWREAAGIEWGGRYVRGFLEGVYARPQGISALAPALQREPFTVDFDLSRYLENDIEATPAWYRKLAKNPVLATVTTMNSETSGMGAERFAALLKSPNLKNLSKIAMFQDEIGTKGVRAIAGSPSPFVLTELGLNSGIGDEGMTEQPATVAAVRVLATHPRFASLAVLGLQFNSLGNKSIELLLNSKTLRQGLRLGLGGNAYDQSLYNARLSERFDWTDFL